MDLFPLRAAARWWSSPGVLIATPIVAAAITATPMDAIVPDPWIATPNASTATMKTKIVPVTPQMSSPVVFVMVNV